MGDSGAVGSKVRRRSDAAIRLRLRVVAILVAISACANRPPPADNAHCAELFDQLDAIEFVPQPGALSFDFRQMQLSRLRQARCLTFTRNLAGLEVLAGDLESHAPPAGPLLRPTVAVQAGVVTNMQDEARALAFFQLLGYRARSVGWPNLGSRIYVEARTLPQIDDIVSIAQQAGFVGPYPSRWERF
jgi:hypothetical protein